MEAHIRDEWDFKQVLTEKMREIGRMFPNAGYGDRCYDWLMEDDAPAYGSYSNGSAMRVSPVAWVAESLEELYRVYRAAFE